MKNKKIDTVTLSGNGSLVIENKGEFEPIAELHVGVTGVPTGTSPKLTITVDFSLDGVTYPASMAITLPVITGTLAYKIRKIIQGIEEKYIRINWKVSAGASFPGCSIWLNGPDHFYTFSLDGKEQA